MACEVFNNCLNNINCFDCAFDGDKYSEFGMDLYNPIDKSIKQPTTESRKQAFKEAKKKSAKADKIAKNSAKNKDKQKLLKEANRTEAKVLKTLNSGRVSKDGDMGSRDLTIDVKLCSTTQDWPVKREEFQKVQGDAARANKNYGVLAMTNKLGETVYVIPEELFKEIL
jgi:hypothetical protein